jgi:hypothetical protein
VQKPISGFKDSIIKTDIEAQAYINKKTDLLDNATKNKNDDKTQ